MKSIRTRLTLGLVAGLALLLGAGGAALYYRTKSSLERQDDAALLSRAWALAASVQVDEDEVFFVPAPALLAEFERADKLAGYEIRRRDGSLFARSPALEKLEPAQQALSGRTPTFVWSALRDERPAREVRLSVPVLSEPPNPHPPGSTSALAYEVAELHERKGAFGRTAASLGSLPSGGGSSRQSATAHEPGAREPVSLEHGTTHEATDTDDEVVLREATVTKEAAGARENSSLLPTVQAGSSQPATSRMVVDEFSIRVVEELPETRSTLAGLRATILVVITLAFVMSLLLVHFVLQRGLSPLERMAAQAQKIEAESLDQRFSSEPLPAELEPIRTRLNDLLDRLEQSFERERRFNAAVAHELRTPIAELRALSEIALRWPESADAKKNMSDVLAVAQEMQSVIEALLTLRRVESGAEKVELELVRVDEVVRSTIATYGKAADARDQTLRVNVPTNLTIESHLHMLRSIVSNLVSNAIEYAPKGSTIAIEARIENERFTFSTRNPAADLTPDDVLHLFEPFWRKDAVRTTGSHAGLGLTLTESLAKALGCTVHAQLEPAGVLKIELAGALISHAPPNPSSGSAPRSDIAKERVEII